MSESTDENLPKKKTVDGLTKMYKEMKGTESATFALGGVFSALGFLEPLMKPLEVILTIVGSLFKVMAAEILPPVMDALQPLFDALMELQPVFAQLGQQIGALLAVVLPPLINLFLRLFQAIQPVIPKIMDFISTLINLLIQAITPLLPPITNIINLIVDLAVSALPLLIPVLTNIINIIIIVLRPILDWLNSLSPSELALVIYTLGIGLSALYGLYTGGPWLAALYAGLWAAVMSPLLFMQEGAILTRPTAMVGGEAGAEGVIPLDQFWSKMDEMTYQQQQTNEYLYAIYKDKKFRHDLRRGF